MVSSDGLGGVAHGEGEGAADRVGVGRDDPVGHDVGAVVEAVARRARRMRVPSTWTSPSSTRSPLAVEGPDADPGVADDALVELEGDLGRGGVELGPVGRRRGERRTAWALRRAASSPTTARRRHEEQDERIRFTPRARPRRVSGVGSAGRGGWARARRRARPARSRRWWVSPRAGRLVPATSMTAVANIVPARATTIGRRPRARRGCQAAHSRPMPRATSKLPSSAGHVDRRAGVLAEEDAREGEDELGDGDGQQGVAGPLPDRLRAGGGREGGEDGVGEVGDRFGACGPGGARCWAAVPAAKAVQATQPTTWASTSRVVETRGRASPSSRAERASWNSSQRMSVVVVAGGWKVPGSFDNPGSVADELTRLALEAGRRRDAR